MAFHYTMLLFLSLLLPFLSSTNQTPLTNQSQFFSLLNNSLKGNVFSYWNLAKPTSFCNYSGVNCDKQGFVTEIDFTGWSLSGHFPENICSYFPNLRILRLGHNNFRTNFPIGITNCSFLEELSLNFAYFSGKLPDLSPLSSLKILDLSYNSFSGDFPVSATNLTNLVDLNFNENDGFKRWKLPEEISRLKKLKTMVLTTCMLSGFIPRSIGNMTELVDLELSGNFLVGKIPKEIGFLKNLKQLELYYNQLDGEIPEELGNLTELIELDISVNKLSGSIPGAICRLPKLQVLQLYNNTLTGEIPETISDSKTLTTLSLYDNLLTGRVPHGLGRSCPLNVLELSENRLTGNLPTETCNLGKLRYYLVLGNLFSGEVPRNYEKCDSLLRFRVNNNRLEGSVPEGLFALPHVSIIDLSYNRLNGSISDKIGSARNLSELFIQSNMLSGVLPREISRAVNLVKIDLSNNKIYGPIPLEIGKLRKLNVLMLQGNKLNSTIPNSLSLLKSLNVLDLANNQLMGNIPFALTKLLPNWMNFSDNLLTGPIPELFITGGLVESFSGNPGLCVTTYLNSSEKNFPICGQSYNRKRVNCAWVIGISVGFAIIGFLLFLKRWLSKEDSTQLNDDTSSSSFFSYDIKSFHKISFDQREIIEAMVNKNIVGQGGSGTVYRIGLSSGEVVAVKKLWTSRKTKDFVSEDQNLMDKEMKTEVDTLGSVRHKNIVKLYSYFSSLDINLLVYEYMPNGNLWDTLHSGKIVLDWPTRHQIGLGVAQGLAYLHHDLKPSIIHRDIKSTNILLDVNYQPKVADFGIAKVLQARGGKDSSTTVMAGTYGYLAPEYAYSSKATTKCDVYSFGVVLMELITGRKPQEAEFGENKSIIYWISTKVETKEGAMEVLDKRLSGSFKEEMIKVLKIAIRCTYRAPANRPNMNEVVQLLIDADPCKFEKYKSLVKTKETTNGIKPKDPYD